MQKISLKDIVDAVPEIKKPGDAPYVFADLANMAKLVEMGFVEGHPTLREGEKVAFRPTPKGYETLTNQTNQTNRPGLAAAATPTPAPAPADAPAPAASDEAAKPTQTSFVISDSIPVPPISRRGSRTATYPFADLEVNQSFFIEATEDRPNPSKSLASTVSSAARRFADKVGETEKKDKDGNVVMKDGKPVMVDVLKKTREFTIRAVVENGVKGARVWRTA